MAEKIRSYKDLIVWQKAISLVLQTYKITEAFPQGELFGLVSQLRRAAISIPSNIAEGSRRGTKKDFLRFIYNAFGSGAELETQLEISLKLNYIDNKSYSEITETLVEIQKMLNTLIKKLRT